MKHADITVAQCESCRWSKAEPIGSGPRTVLICDAPVEPRKRLISREMAKGGNCKRHEREPGAEG